MAKTRLKLIAPATVKRTVAPPRRRPNAELRPREHLTEREVEKLIEAAKGNRHGGRDSAMILVCFRHGLRASEVVELQWSDVEFETGTLHLRRAKGGQTSTHPLLGDEMRALRALKRDAKSPFIFVSERGAPFTVSGLQKMVERVGIEAKLPFKVHPHMLRHATGYALANKGTDTRTLQAYLGHRSIQSDGQIHRTSARPLQEPVAMTLKERLIRPAPTDVKSYYIRSEATDFLISGSKVRVLVRPPNSSEQNQHLNSTAPLTRIRFPVATPVATSVKFRLMISLPQVAVTLSPLS